jgi:hypothetical protein
MYSDDAAKTNHELDNLYRIELVYEDEYEEPFVEILTYEERGFCLTSTKRFKDGVQEIYFKSVSCG